MIFFGRKIWFQNLQDWSFNEILCDLFRSIYLWFIQLLKCFYFQFLLNLKYLPLFLQSITKGIVTITVTQNLEMINLQSLHCNRIQNSNDKTANLQVLSYFFKLFKCERDKRRLRETSRKHCWGVPLKPRSRFYQRKEVFGSCFVPWTPRLRGIGVASPSL